MKYYFAPLEGITNCYYRMAYDKFYSNIDKYYIPFLEPKSGNLYEKDYREINPLNNKLKGKVIPQILSKNSDDTIWFINYLNEIGYDEINLNFGCPSPTVTKKNKGAGILIDLEYLDNYLNEIFSKIKCDISIKMRLGYENVNEFDNIIKILNKYPIKELIIHPRTSLEQYSSILHIDKLKDLDKRTNIDIIYNGEIKTLDDIEYIKNELPFIKGVMIGRGLLENPDMLLDIKDDKLRIDKLKEFYDYFSSENKKLFGWNNSKFFHKEIWAFLINYFDVNKDIKKKLFKENNEKQFDLIVYEIFKTCKININIKSIKNFL